MTLGAHDRLHALFTAALRLDPAERASFLARECGDDVALRSEVEALLEVDAEDALIDTGSERAGGAVYLARVLAESGELETAAAPMPERIGRYRILRVIGEGGMGTVYEAEQEDPRRRVALKVVRSSMVTRGLLRRFRQEAQVLGLLKHPGIAQIYEAGTADSGEGGQPYFAMELIDGVNVLEYADARGLGSRERLRLVADLCDALHHAHQKGVVHRDLKPPNVLVTEAGQPKILDFGVARATDADMQTVTLGTDVGQLVGTVPYMSPEQAAGDPAELDIRSDVYSVGVLAYELLAGRLPYDVRGKLVHEAVRVIREDEPSRLSAVDRSLRGDVETIIGKALSKEKERRYQSAAELAADIRRSLADEPIVARPASTFYQVRKFTRRNTALVAGVAATVLVSISGAIIAGRYAFTASRHAAELERASYVSGIAAAVAAIEQHDHATAAAYLDRTPAALRGWEYEHLRARLTTHLHEWDIPAPLVQPLVYGPDGRSVFGVMEGDLFGEWHASTGTVHRTWTVDGLSSHYAPVLHGPTLQFAAALADESIGIGGLEPGRVETVLPSDGTEHALPLGWDAAGRTLLYRTDAMRTWDGAASRVVLEKRVGTSILNPDGRVVARGEREVALVLYDAPEANELARTSLLDRPRAIVLSPDGATVAMGGMYRNAQLFDSRTLEPGHRLPGHRAAVTGVAWTLDGNYVVTVDRSGIARVWEAVSGRLVAAHAAGDPGEPLFDRPLVTIAPDGGHFIVAAGTRCRLFPLEPRGVLRGHEGFVYHVTFSPDGSRLASSGYRDPSLYVWDPRSASLVARLTAPATTRHLGSDFHAAPAVAFTLDGRRLVAGSRADTVAYDVKTGAALAVSDSIDGDLRFRETLGREHSMRTTSLTVYDRHGRTPADLLGARLPVNAVARSLTIDGDRVAFTAGDEVVVYDTGRTDEAGRLIGHVGPVFCIAFSPDGTRIATGGNDMTIRIWEARTFEQLLVLRGHEQYVKELAFSPDGTILASASGDLTVRLWDTVSPAIRERAGR